MSNNFNLNDIDIMGNESTFLKNINNIFISENHIKILKKYGINIENYINVNELIYDIESYLNDSYDELDDLEWVSATIQENNYYNNTNK